MILQHHKIWGCAVLVVSKWFEVALLPVSMMARNSVNPKWQGILVMANTVIIFDMKCQRYANHMPNDYNFRLVNSYSFLIKYLVTNSILQFVMEDVPAGYFEHQAKPDSPSRWKSNPEVLLELFSNWCSFNHTLSQSDFIRFLANRRASS